MAEQLVDSTERAIPAREVHRPSVKTQVMGLVAEKAKRRQGA